jgi:sugar lactone lactonase YvrE
MKTIPFLIVGIVLTLTTNAYSQPDYYMYVSDAGGFNNPPWQILRYNLDGSNPQVFIDNDFFVSEGVGWPQDILFLEDQNQVLISNLVGNRITKHDATTGTYIEDFATVDGGPTRMKIGSDDLIYVVQWSGSNNKVLRYQQDGTFMGEFTDEGGILWDQ